MTLAGLSRAGLADWAVEAYCGGGYAAVRVGVAIDGAGQATTLDERYGSEPLRKEIGADPALTARIAAELDAAGFETLETPGPAVGAVCGIVRARNGGQHAVLWPRGDRPPAAIAPVFDALMALHP